MRPIWSLCAVTTTCGAPPADDVAPRRCRGGRPRGAAMPARRRRTTSWAGASKPVGAGAAHRSRRRSRSVAMEPSGVVCARAAGEAAPAGRSILPAMARGGHPHAPAMRRTPAAGARFVVSLRHRDVRRHTPAPAAAPLRASAAPAAAAARPRARRPPPRPASDRLARRRLRRVRLRRRHGGGGRARRAVPAPPRPSLDRRRRQGRHLPGQLRAPFLRAGTGAEAPRRALEGASSAAGWTSGKLRQRPAEQVGGQRLDRDSPTSSSTAARPTSWPAATTTSCAASTPRPARSSGRTSTTTSSRAARRSSRTLRRRAPTTSTSSSPGRGVGTRTSWTTRAWRRCAP